MMAPREEEEEEEEEEEVEVESFIKSDNNLGVHLQILMNSLSSSLHTVASFKTRAGPTRQRVGRAS
jgi:hypothetical protein